ncbi:MULTISPECIES: B12-binding domain-containing radical SAM protein [Pseudomonas syringae group]|uniref:Radical SAM domain-containing protein n=1 Tax=Pseudomonas syringae pv. ribicola TaxID=55398 RepID=A0A0Q0B9N9_PSESI|nr:MULTISPECIES: radical SAM protein [Pseudomonas syringae group]EKN46716.1 radical SAM domain-containing protein [Pseudomonas viridiflava UASWS0038]KPY43618.1 Radical SAM domain-containing protein [Pseudomonas syringae pv. ribicola]KPZ28300.1 Radical SAM domain-containing protein [Pseudomonas viridiflava]MBI6701863.1 radical SAM protein [Pseudomonas viridiflava]MBI6722275.1 radical SAM protein [Pseudomonas viridiflava]
MKRSNTVAFISAGMLSPKKRDHILARRQLYLNYGVLSLATILDAIGTETVLVHGEHRGPAEVLRRLLEQGALPSRYPIMLSIPSFYALPWAQEFCRLARHTDPEAKIIVGGRWVVGPDPDWLREKLPEADLLISGLAEPQIASLLTNAPDLRILPAPTPNIALNHTLVSGFEQYQPSIEASRGCGMGCAFCEERDIPLEKLGAPYQVANALAAVVAQYGTCEIRPYFQSSMFVPNVKWGTGLANAIRTAGLNIRWRTESRVDALTPETIACLAEAGLRVLDLGLETASPTQILNMNKSPHPDRYLKRASTLLKACNDHGIATKVNILLYAGETTKTFDETRSFLDEHKSSIAGVSVGPVVAYGPPKTADILLREWSRSGATPVDPDSADRCGISMIHLSRDFDAKSAELASLELSRRYMDTEAYFNLKSFSYYPRDYTRLDFDRDVAASDASQLPFRTS